MTPLIIIPARMQSQRLPRKPLADICGKPMIVHVLERGLEADLGPVVVACDDPLIIEAVSDFGGQAVLTDPALPSGSDRVYAAAEIFDRLGAFDILINLQGDMPGADPSHIRASVEPLSISSVDVATLAVPIADVEKIENPHVAKIALAGKEGDLIRRALYFSRSPIPNGAPSFYHHLGLYAYRREALKKFISAAPTCAEESEKLEQLRALELGLRIDVRIVEGRPWEVNTPEDLDYARTYFSKEGKKSA